jgi:hypothetical protein
MTDSEYEELLELRDFKAMIELSEADYANPNVILLEGLLSPHGGDGPYAAWAVKTRTGMVYLTEVIDELNEWSGSIMLFAWHITSDPLGFHQLEEHLVQTAMGVTKTQFCHSYSDLTGYLWTDEKVTVNCHDFLKEIRETVLNMGQPAYIALRVEKDPAK